MHETGPPGSSPSANELRAAFDRAPAYTLGMEEEVMLLDPETFDLAPRAPELLERLDDDARFKLELPASQLEIVMPPMSDAGEIAVSLLKARRALAAAADGLVREYGSIAARQLVCAQQVHVSVGDSDRALAVYNRLREYLPLLAALAANAPFYEGADSGLASVRPKLCELLPRQGVPPAIESWEAYAAMLRWGQRAGAFPQPRAWWWELRLHPRFGTLE